MSEAVGLTENDNFAESSPPQRIIVWPVHSMHGAAVLVPLPLAGPSPLHGSP